MHRITQLTPGYLNKMIQEGTDAVRHAIRLCGDPTRQGGYFCIADGETGFPLVITAIGTVAEEKAEKYLALCQEKARRLARNQTHLSSWESRDPEENEWAGAVRGNRLIGSFSALPELWDEAAMLRWAFRTSELTEGQAMRIASISGNTNFYLLQQSARR